MNENYSEVNQQVADDYVESGVLKEPEMVFDGRINAISEEDHYILKTIREIPDELIINRTRKGFGPVIFE